MPQSAKFIMGLVIKRASLERVDMFVLMDLNKIFHNFLHIVQGSIADNAEEIWNEHMGIPIEM